MEDNNLKELYNNAFNETKHYRTYQWQIAVWGMTLLALISALPKGINDFGIMSFCIITFLIACTLAIFGLAVYLILDCHLSLTRNRKIIWKIERIWEFEKIEYKGEPILPKEITDNQPTFRKGARHLIIWAVLLSLFMFYTLLQLSIAICKL